jgi:hypothetical protein
MKIRGSFSAEGATAIGCMVAAAAAFYALAPLLLMAGLGRWATEPIPDAERRRFWTMLAVTAGLTVHLLWLAGAGAAAIARSIR